ncbi:MAG: thioredoxin family protein [Thomasclavelia sp.]|nr:thioredoxin family protein [Thomasclavelia sp.]
METLDSINTKDKYLDAIKTKSILIFSADWCPDCMFLKQFINEIINNNQQYDFYYVNRDDMIDLCKELDVFGIPSFIAYDNSKELGRFVSKNRKTKEEIQKFIDSLGD